ncbi:MAG: mechanosensitive ion channel domain-containing protein, partial [Bdellovibrio bacteriovorus]
MANLAPGAEIERIERSLPAISAELDQTMGNTLSLLRERPSLEILQAQEEHWAQRQRALEGWLDALTTRATRLQGDLDLLDQQRALWTETQTAVRAQETPAALVQQVEAVLAAIDGALPRTRLARDHTLDLQARVAEQVGHCERVRSRIGQLQQAVVGGILARDGVPIWSPALWDQAGGAVVSRLSQIGGAFWGDARLYLSDPAKHMPIHLGVFLLALASLLAARGRVEDWAAQGQDVSRLVPVFNRPVAAALLFALALATGFNSPAPQTVKELFGALALLPMILLARPVLRPAFRPALYVLGFLFALDAIRRAFGGIPPLVGQSIILAQAVAGAAVLVPLMLAKRGADLGRGTFRRLVTGLALGVLAVGFGASLLGYLGLARLSAPAVLVAAADALWLFAVVEVGMAVTAFALRVWPLRRLHMVEHHRGPLERRIYRLFLALAVLAWTWRYLSYLGLWEPMLGYAGGLLATRLQMGSFGTSVADILAFVATLVVAFALSSLLRFVLEEEVYPRAGVPSGTAYAASSVIHYAIVALAFFLALGVLGVSLTQVTVLAGALGVGLGFGLQGIVHNFVSGLILLFERPIHVGDAVQVGSLQGWVRRIGIRASVIRTVQGAEIIVPNSQLTSEQVTNWTLSDQQRRIDLPVGLSYGAAPSRVIELLEGVACTHPRVLKHPP